MLIVTAAHAGFNARARQFVAERGTAEQRAVCDELWSGRLDSSEKMQRYYELMGPLYSRKHDAAAARLSRERGILSPEAINQAFAPGGFLQTFDLRPELECFLVGGGAGFFQLRVGFAPAGVLTTASARIQDHRANSRAGNGAQGRPGNI